VKDQAQWKWGKGQTTIKADFGNPLGTTDYQLCIYANGAFVSKAFIPAGGTCAGKPCWKENAKGFQYKDKDATPAGVTQLKLKEGLVDGKAQIQVKEKGANIDFPPLPLAPPVRVQPDRCAWECGDQEAPATTVSSRASASSSQERTSSAAWPCSRVSGCSPRNDRCMVTDERPGSAWKTCSQPA